MWQASHTGAPHASVWSLDSCATAHSHRGQLSTPLAHTQVASVPTYLHVDVLTWQEQGSECKTYGVTDPEFSLVSRPYHVADPRVHATFCNGSALLLEVMHACGAVRLWNASSATTIAMPARWLVRALSTNARLYLRCTPPSEPTPNAWSQSSQIPRHEAMTTQIPQ